MRKIFTLVILLSIIPLYCHAEYYDYIMSVPIADTPVFTEQNPKPLSFVFTDVYNDGSVDRQSFIERTEEVSPENKYTNVRVIGKWDSSGNVVGSVHSDYFILRPLGNIDGKATPHLDYHHFQGSAEVKKLTSTSVYPSTNTPFSIKIEHYWHDDVSFPGWGWRATMVSDDPLRDINVRAIGVYSDSDCANYLYTTGAFVFNDPNYQTETPAGFHINQQERPTWYLALLYSATKEGCVELRPEWDNVEMLFWAQDVTP